MRVKYCAGYSGHHGYQGGCDSNDDHGADDFDDADDGMVRVGGDGHRGVED